MNEFNYDVVIVGAGPAGLAAAKAAPEPLVALIDENPHLGGQIWRGMQDERRGLGSRRPGLAHHMSTAIIDAPEPGVLVGIRGGEAVRFRYRKLILATGARELMLPFPGWTLPGVATAGGLQALAKGGLEVQGKRVVVAGSGPLLLAVGDYFRSHRAQLVGLYEQASPKALSSFGLAAARAGGKVGEAGRILAKVGPRLRLGWWVTEAHGSSKLEAITVTNGRRTKTVPCDYLAISYGLVPNLELALLLGCHITENFVAVNARQETSVKSVYCVGEGTGIGGVEKAIHEGVVAALSGDDETNPSPDFKRSTRIVHRMKPFTESIRRSFALRQELLHLAAEDTIVCRCEDVRLRDVLGKDGARDAKLQTRCGMGPCQGRMCSPALQVLLGWRPDSVRPPIIPVPASALAAQTTDSELS